MRPWSRSTGARARTRRTHAASTPAHPRSHAHLLPSSGLARRVTFDSLRKFKHLTISLGFKAVSDVCQAAFDHPETDFDEFPEVAPDTRPGCWCTLEPNKFTELTAASTALVKMFLDEKGELPPAAEARIIRVEKKFYYDDV
jgi:hypothetical protein